MKNLKKIFIVFIYIIFSSNIHSQPLNGTYTIGSGGNYSTISAAMTALRGNGVSGNVTFSILNGSYAAATIDYSTGIPNLGTYDTITFTSSTNNAANVTFTSTSNTLTINNAKNLVIKNITIDASSGQKSIQLTGNCENIEINRCIIRAMPNGQPSSAYAGIYYQRNYSLSPTSNNIRIINNSIDGGYYGIYIYGYGYSNYSTNLVIDKNTITNTYLCGLYCNYANFNSISGNLITSRMSNTSTTFYGLYLNNANATKVNANKIQTLTTAITDPYGMLFQYFNYRNTSVAGLISNNEIFMYTNSNRYGMYVVYSRANIYHNSILIGGSGAASGLYINAAAGYPINIRNNNFHMIAASAYPIYIPDNNVSYLGTYITMDYNNYYNQSYVGYAGGNRTTMTDWQTVTGQDIHSMSIYPNYTDLFSYTLQTDGEDIICPRIASVPKDIKDSTRQGITSMGAYHNFVPQTNDIKILTLLSPAKDVTVGVTLPVRITIMNMGANPVDSIDIYWKVNGTTQVYQWTSATPLALGDTTSAITLGYFTPHAGENDVLIYTKISNGIVDTKPLNDTVKIKPFGCKSIINSVYTVGGTGADFTTISEALDVLSYCGILTPTILSINPGTYNENIIIHAIDGTSTTNTLTIQSASGDSTSVIIQSLTTNPTITFFNTNNIILKNLTIKGKVTGQYSIAIKLQNSNKNITIANNLITTANGTPSSTTPTDMMAIHSLASLDTNLDILNNRIIGSGGIYVLSGGYSSSSYNINIINNLLENIYDYGIYSEYTRIGKIINNKIYQDPMAAIFGGRGYGIYVYYSYGVTSTITDISRNRIRGSFQTFTNFSYCFSSYGTYNDVLFTNNILIKTGTGTTADMLYINYGQWQCINNTFVNIGSGTVTDMAHIASYTSTNINFSNNILSNLTGVCTQLMNWVVSYGTYTLDYNDYYTINGNIAYQSSTTYSTLAAWKSAQPSFNIHSKSVHPQFIDSLNYVKPTNWGFIMCPRHSYVPMDRDENVRAEQTYMGCYEPLFIRDAGLTGFISPTASSTAGDTTQIIVTLVNYGSDTLKTLTFEYSVNGVLQTPITINNLNLKKHDKTTINVGFFIPTLYISSTVKVWCKNPNGLNDQNLYNDTISISTAGCALVLNGEYTIGSASSADFPTISAALAALNGCGVSGPVVFKLLTGTYSGFSISNTYSGVSATNTITFTSAAQNADSVIIQSNSVALLLGNTYNLRFTFLTFDARNGSIGVQFNDTCNNIEIKYCKIKTNPTSSSSNNIGINKGTYSFAISNIRIIKNIIDGGYYGIYLYGANSLAKKGKNCMIDSNVISNVYYRAVYLMYYQQYQSISYNTVTSRTNNAGYQFDGLYLYYYTDVDTVTGNKINSTLSSSTSYGTGIYCYAVNYSSSTASVAQITNNEIRLQNNGDAIYLYYIRADVKHNTMYLTGNSGTINGINIYYPNTTYPITATNNNIVNLSSTSNSTAIKITNSSTLTGFTLDYNNYYTTSGNIGSTGTSPSYYTLSSWQSVTGNDAHSTNILPTFINTSSDLLIDGNQLLCPRLPSVLKDRNNIVRKPLTNMGAYHTYTPLAFDISPLAIISPTEDVSNYVSVPVILTVMNRGDTAITSFDIHWSVNGVAQTTYHWTGSPITLGNSTPPIIVDYYTPALGNNNFKFYTSNPNGHTDGNTLNDTISVRSFACGAELEGIYTIGGSSADFDSISTAIRALYACGVSNNVIFKINSGSYYQDINLPNSVIDAGYNYTVTFTSTANNPDSVKIISNNIALSLGTVRNLNFKNLTFDVRSGNVGIQFNNTCSNIEISGCKILMAANSTNSGHIGINKANNTGVLDFITIKNNLIDGGYYGVFIYGGTYISGYIFGTNVVIDSNTITNAYYCGIYTYYTDLTSISYNFIKNRSSNSNSNFHGMYLYYSNAIINGNKIHITNSISQPYGIRLYYYNYTNTSYPGLITNNEIITNASYSAYGIYFDGYYYKANVVNNSILCKGGSSAIYNRGIFVNYFSTYSCLISIKNNNIVHETYGYPIYFGATPISSVLTIDYNNYYAPTYVGYVNGNITTLSAWKSATGQDVHSVRVNPSFINSSVNLNLVNGNGLSCVKDPNTLTDINAVNRKTRTTMGAYEVIYELAVSSILHPINGSNQCSNNLSDVEIVLSNLNATDINFATDPVYVHIQVMGAMNFSKDTTLSIGSIAGLNKDTFIVVKNLLLTNSGNCSVKVFLTSMDNLITNDTAQITFRINPSYSLKDTLTLCADELPITYGDSIFPIGTHSGNYLIHKLLPSGCDSLITLTLKINPTYSRRDTVSICNNELPFNYGDSIFPIGTHSGNYPIHFTLPTGCDSLITLTLKVNPTYSYKDTLTICNSQLPYRYGDSIFAIGTLNGNHSIHFTLPTGCDSLILLTLYVNPTYKHYDTITLCDNEFPITYGSTTFITGTTSGNYPIHFTLPTGCDSLIMLTLHVNPTYKFTDTMTICQDELPFLYGDSTFSHTTVSGNYPIHFTLPSGCDSLITLTLHINPSYYKYDTITICDSDFPFSYGDTTFLSGTTTGNFILTYKLSTGCDSIIHLHLIVNPSYMEADTLTICNDLLPLTYGDSIFPIGTKSGTYPVHFTLPTGCDSLINFTLLINPTYNYPDTLTLCYGDLPYSFGDSTLTSAGNYLIAFSSIYGCDSIVNLHLNVFNCQGTDIVDICDSELPFIYGDSTFNKSGIYQVVFKAYNGSDSIIALTLRVHGTYNVNDTLELCSGDLPYSYEDTIVPSAGSYSFLLTSSYGCDSLVNLTVNVHPDYNFFDTISKCDIELPFTFGDSIYTSSGNYTLFKTSKYGCDSVIHLTLFVYPTYIEFDTLSICFNELPYSYGDSIFTPATINGTYPVHFTLSSGCDSLVNVTLTILNSYSHNDTITLCNNELPYRYGDSIFRKGTTSGLYPVVYTLPTGCDSVINLQLYIHPDYTLFDTITLCESDFPFSYGDTIFNMGTLSGHYIIDYLLPSGCDSIIYLRLIVNHTYHHNDTIIMKDVDLPLQYGDSLFAIGTHSGTYKIIFTLSTGCDSIINLHLIINPSYKVYDTLSVCNSELPFYYGDSIFNAGSVSGDYKIVFTLSSGSDSTIFLHLIVNPTYHFFDTITLCDNELPYSYQNTVFNVGTITGDYPITYTSSTGCDSIFYLKLLINPTYQLFDTIEICDTKLPYSYADTLFDIGTISGDYTIHTLSAKGCDSLIYLHLTVNPNYEINDTIHACDSEFPINYAGNALNDAGDYTIPLTTTTGCDSIIKLHVIKHQSYRETVMTQICDSELPYTFVNQKFDFGGTYQITLPTIHGCDSTITLFLVVRSSPLAPSTIIGDDKISQIGKYMYSAEPVFNATSYNWNITNNQWMGNSKTNSITVFVPTPGYGTLSVKAVNECGESEATTLYIRSTVGINQFENQNSISIYPNPANNYFFLKTNGIYGKTSIRISDLSGKILYTEEIKNIESNQLLKFSISDYAKGFYFITIVNNENTIVKKLIIE